MEKLQKNLNSNIPLVDYVPAELRRNREWNIVFYVLNPFSNKLVRKRRRVKPMNNATLRLKYARRIVAEINIKLEKGWNPFIEDEATRSFASLNEVAELYLKRLEKQLKDKSLRPDTVRSYRSYIKNLQEYMIRKGKEEMYCLHFDSAFVQGFIDHIYYERNNSTGTHNNYLLGIRIFCKYLLQRDFIKIDPTSKIETKKKERKKRKVIPKIIREKIGDYFSEYNKDYMTLCLATYYCFIRRTELTKLKVKDVKLLDGYILIDGGDSKNHKTEPITIPNEYINMLAHHIKGAKNSDYLFSENNYKCGDIQLKPKAISDEWSKMRKKLKLSDVYQFYSLKDSGITELLNSGIPAIKVRDQARHHDLKVTEGYTDRNNGADTMVKNSTYSF